MIRLPRSPYPARELAGFAWRMWAGAPTPELKAGALDAEVVLAAEAPVTARVVVLGDVMPLMWRRLEVAPDVAAAIGRADHVVANLEGVFTDAPWFPFLQKHLPSVLDRLAALAPPSRWVLGVANNHAPDYGPQAFEATLRRLEAGGFAHVGATARPRVTLRPGVTVTAWTEWANGPAPMVARRDPGAPAEPGVHLAFPHWGHELERRARAGQRARVPSGYALIAGHHSHLPQPLERLDDGRVVAWSLGNFATEVKLRDMGEGALLELSLTEVDGAPALARVALRELRLDRGGPRVCRVRFAAGGAA